MVCKVYAFSNYHWKLFIHGESLWCYLFLPWAIRCFFFGDTSAKRDPDLYSKCICALSDYYQLKCHSHNCTVDGMPLIVNTSGWVKGIVLSCIYRSSIYNPCIKHFCNYSLICLQVLVMMCWWSCWSKFPSLMWSRSTFLLRIKMFHLGNFGWMEMTMMAFSW